MSDFERSLVDVKEEIRERSDIVDIIGQYTRLKKTGKNWMGLCPFHADKKPSFSVNPEMGIYKCWSCGEAGSVITFIEKKENLEFIEALEWLAKRAGIAFERKKGNPQQSSEREQAYDLNRLAVEFFRQCLTRSDEAKAYVVRRGLLVSTQEQWEVGFAPHDRDALAYHLQRRGADMELAAKIGLVKAWDGGGYNDAFRNRLMFPIHDLQGRIVAFGGRAMDDHPAKYLNSPASLIFDKSRTLYGLHFARKRLGSDTPPVFVEGYVDVITTHQAGFGQCVATLGTSLTEEHARMLVKYNPRVIMCYDSDGAGIKAALKGAAIWESSGVENAEVRVARLPDGDDPDSILKDRPNGKALFQAALDNAIPRVDFQIELSLKRHNTQTEQGRADALAEFIPILATIREHTRRDRYAQKFAYLSPLHNYDLGRAINSLLADAEMYAKQTDNAQSPRDRGYPLSENANGQPLSEQAPPPAWRGPDNRQRPGNPNNSNGNGYARPGYNGSNGNGGNNNNGNYNNGGYGGSSGWPNTRQVIRKGEGGASDKSGYGKSGWGRGRKEGPATDGSPPSLDMPALSGAEKAERQLLRALFSQDWRVYILNNMQSNLLVTPYGRRLYDIIARTPANSEGAIDPSPLLHRAQNEEEQQSQALQNEAATALSDTQDTNTSPLDDGNWDAKRPYPRALNNSLKFSGFILEVLEDSTFIASNEQLNEAAVANCIARLKKHRDEQEARANSALLYDMERLPPEQQRAAMNQYLEKMRALRGSPPGEDAA